MTFELRLRIPTKLKRADPGRIQYDPELDDVGSVLHDICEALDLAGVSFLARVCSDQDWPVTVRTDLHVVIEQLNDVLVALTRRDIARLDFYEQGIERTVSFLPNNGTVLIECTDMIPDATSKQETVILSRNLVIEELIRLAEDFLRVARMHCPELTSHPWFEEWATALMSSSDGIRAHEKN